MFAPSATPRPAQADKTVYFETAPNMRRWQNRLPPACNIAAELMVKLIKQLAQNQSC